MLNKINNSNPILLVEDDSIDAMMVNRALKELKITNKLIHSENGEEALVWLRSENQKMPCIILLDLNMPRMGGLEFLEIIKKDDLLKSIPIVILTTSAEHQDLKKSYSHSVAGYMIKPVDYDDFVEMMKTISAYWSQSMLPL